MQRNTFLNRLNPFARGTARSVNRRTPLCRRTLSFERLGLKARRLSVEPLENRLLLSVFTVTNTNDSGDGSLRQAILDANLHANDDTIADTIAFNIPGDGPHTIQPLSALPTITDPVVIDGYTQPGASPNTNPVGSGLNTQLKIELDGSTTENVNGLTLSTDNCTIRGLAINGFDRDGIDASSGNHVIEGNFIGTDVLGTVALGNGIYGIHIKGSRNRIGTNGDGVADDGERNLISGNGNSGVEIGGAGADENVVAGNYIGTDAAGRGALSNGDAVPWDGGIVITGGADSNRIGTNGDGLADEQERNIISGNTGYGVNIESAGSDHNIVAGNYIGVDITGGSALPNTITGVLINPYGGGPKWNRIGADGSDDPYNAHERNIISGNGSDGVRISGDGIEYNTVAGNYIGTDATGKQALGNGGNGVYIKSGAQRNVIGTDGDGVADGAEGNIISGNNGVGIWVRAADHNTIAGNFVGTDVTGSYVIGNGSDGVGISEGGQYNTIGTNGDGVSDDAERNVISGSRYSGIWIGGWTGEGPGHNVVAGNYIGTDATGTVALGNGYRGVHLTNGARANRVGTDGNGVADAAERNVISGNAAQGVLLDETGTDQNLVAGNYIGTDVTGTVPLGNASPTVVYRGGVDIWGDARFNRIEGNVISANTNDGVQVRNGASQNVVVGNFIGTDTSGDVAIGNGRYGVNGYGGFSNRFGTLAGPGSAAVPPTLNYDASLDDDGDGNWQDTVGTPDGNTGSDADFHFTLDSGVARVAAASSLSGISAAYRFDGTGGGDESSLMFIPENPSDATATWEIWFKPVGDGDVDILFESGGSVDGMSIRYDGPNNEVLFTVDDSDVQRTVRGGAWLIDTNEFNQLVAVYRKNVDAAGNDVLHLYVNGQLVDDSVDSPTTLLNDWSGSNEIGVARIGGSSVPQTGEGTAYEGDLAIIRFYESALLAGDVQTNFTAVGGAPDEGNTIAFNGLDGVCVAGDTATANAIRGNRVYRNGGLGIELGGDGVTVNDPGDADTGANYLQNYPEITEAEAFLTQTRVAGTLDSLPGETFAIDFYASTTADPSGYGEGERWLGSITVTTHTDGNASFTEALPAMTIPGEVITATATDADGNTSEFSAAVTVQPQRRVQIDVKPGSDSNPVNLNGNGVISVAILADANFDPSCVQVDTVVFAGAYAVQHAFEDADGDGDLDLVMQFRIEDTNLEDIYQQLLADDQNADGILDSTHQEVQAWLFGQTTLDELFAGVDDVDVSLSGKHLRELLDELFGAGLA